MRLRTVEVGGNGVAYAEAGEGGRPFLLLHGFTGAKEDFTDWLDPLAERGWHAVAPDHRGHGASAKPADESSYSLAILAADAGALADELGWSQFALLGHSMGGMVAQCLAIAAPERLTALVLMDTSDGPVTGIDPDLAQAAIGIVRTSGIDKLADILATRQGALSSPAHERLLATRDGYAAFGERKLRATSPALYAALVAELLAQDDRLDALRRLHVPALVIVGEQDVAFLGPSERMAAAIEGARLAVIPDAGHSPQFEAPDAWWAALSSFLDGVAAR